MAKGLVNGLAAAILSTISVLLFWGTLRAWGWEAPPKWAYLLLGYLEHSLILNRFRVLDEIEKLRGPK